MDPRFRKAYNAAFTAEKHAELLRSMERKLGHGVDFRISETPITARSRLSLAWLQK